MGDKTHPFTVYDIHWA